MFSALRAGHLRFRFSQPGARADMHQDQGLAHSPILKRAWGAA